MEYVSPESHGGIIAGEYGITSSRRHIFSNIRIEGWSKGKD